MNFCMMSNFIGFCDKFIIMGVNILLCSYV